EFLDRNSKSDPNETSQQNANPGDQQHNHHLNHPRPRLKGPQPPMLRYRHIAHTANQQLQASFPSNMTSPSKEIIPIACSREGPSRTRIIAAHQGEITPQFRITWKRNCAIWTPGNKAQSANAGPRDAGLPPPCHLSRHRPSLRPRGARWNGLSMTSLSW